MQVVGTRPDVEKYQAPEVNDRESVGIDLVGETLDVAEMYGLIEKGGAWYTIEGERLQGRAKSVQYLRDNPKVVAKLIEKIDAKS